jgi:spore germination cell wall hydrolase CwlJ-like protein
MINRILFALIIFLATITPRAVHNLGFAGDYLPKQIKESGRDFYYSNLPPVVTSQDQKQIVCLAKNIYFESRNQSDLGQIAVAHVTLNRMNHKKFPNTICRVVFQKSQFSWTINGRNKQPYDKAAWDKAKHFARIMYLLPQDDPTEGSTFYHTHAVNPYWNRKMALATVIEDHKFFVWNGKW